MGNNKQGNMEKDFTPHEQALALKEIGFDDPCLKFYATGKLVLGLDTENGDTNTKLNWYNPSYVSAPTFSQSFRFFRDNYGMFHNVDKIFSDEFGYIITNEKLSGLNEL